MKEASVLGELHCTRCPPVSEAVLAPKRWDALLPPPLPPIAAEGVETAEERGVVVGAVAPHSRWCAGLGCSGRD